MGIHRVQGLGFPTSYRWAFLSFAVVEMQLEPGPSFLQIPRLLPGQPGTGQEMGGCQNCGRGFGFRVVFLGTPNIRCRIIIGIQKGTVILTTTQIAPAYIVNCV